MFPEQGVFLNQVVHKGNSVFGCGYKTSALQRTDILGQLQYSAHFKHHILTQRVTGIEPKMLRNQAAEIYCFPAIDTFRKQVGIHAQDRDAEFIPTQPKKVRLHLGQVKLETRHSACFRGIQGLDQLRILLVDLYSDYRPVVHSGKICGIWQDRHHIP